MGLQKPNLFLVGQSKSGTTALHNFLAQHPDIYMSDPKEPRFFCMDLRQESYTFHRKKISYFSFWDEREYLKLFSNSKKEKIVGEASPHYLYSKVAAEKIYTFNPNAKIIMILRNPVDFIYSLHSHYVWIGYENAKDIKTALSIEKARRMGKNIPSRIYCPSALYYSERVKYYEQVNRFYDLFDNSNIKVIIFEDFKKNNHKVYKDILEFLCVDTCFVPEFTMINVNRKPRNYCLNILLENRLLVAAMKSVFPLRYRSSLGKVRGRVLWKKGPRPPMDPLLEEALMRAYRPEVIKIGKLLNVDLEKKWFQKT